MKFFKIFFLIVSISAGSLYAQDWKKLFDVSFNALNDIFFIDDNIGWVVGSSGEYAKSTDGGMTWTKMNGVIPITKSLNSVYFVDANNGFISADEGYFLKTTDGGMSWSADSVELAIGDVEAIHFFDANTGWLGVSDNHTPYGGQILRTTDGGTTWIEDFSYSGCDLEDMEFYGSNFGICSGGGAGVINIYYTSDGVNWNASTLPTFPPVYTRSDARAISIANSTTAYISGWGSRAAGLQPSIQLKTTDAGASWIYLTQLEENRTYVNLYGNWFKDANNGIAVGGGSYEGSVVVRTTDGGTTWLVIEAPFGFTMYSVFGRGDDLWVTGGSGGLVHSSDFGDSWELITDYPSSSLYAMQFITADFAVSAGFDGLLFRSFNGGLDWTAKYVSVNNVCPAIQDICFLDENIGFAARNNKLVTKTTDGGDTWTAILADTFATSFTNYGVFFVSENLGFVVGKVATGIDVIYKTTDGGGSWTETLGQFGETLQDVFFINGNQGAVVGDDMVIAYTTDNGTTWNDATLNGVPSGNEGSDINHLTFLNDNDGLATGQLLLKTTDGGLNWDYVEIPGLADEMKSAYMKDAMNWWVTGDDKIYETTDGGATWTDIADLGIITSSQLYGIFGDSNGFPWVSGSLSGIYTTAPLTSVNEIDLVPVDYTLSQNYPNPFNPETKINYSLAKPGEVTIKVFDILGREVATVLREYKSAGNYNVTFNASSIGSGIYFYTLEINNEMISKKMTLIK